MRPAVLSRLPLSALFVAVLFCAEASAQQQARMTVHVVASGSESTHSEGEWSKATFSYDAEVAITVQTDGEPSDINMHDPHYAEKALAQANITMAKVQAALRGEFSDDEEESVPDYRYLLFMGEMECSSALAIRVAERVEGEYADVGGMQPYTITYTAQSGGTPTERNMLCLSGTSVLDITDNILYRSSLGFPEVTGHYVYHEQNRGNLQDDDQARHHALPPFISDFVFQTLQVAPANGHLKTQLAPVQPIVSRINGAAGYTGSVDVELTWSFVRL